VAAWTAYNYTGQFPVETVRAITAAISLAALAPGGCIMVDKMVSGWPSGAEPFWRVLWLLPALIVASQLLLGSVLVDPYNIKLDWFYIISRLLTLAFSIILCHVMANALRQSAEKISLEEHGKYLEEINRTKTVFLQDIKHEARNPFLIISLGTDAARQYITDGMAEEADKALTVIQNEAVRLGRMINAMVEMADMSGSSKNREQTDFTRLLNHCAETFRLGMEQKRNTLRVVIAPDLPFVYAEAEQLERVPVNLLSNANDCTENGEVTLEASTRDDYITVIVRDTGCGINPELLPRVFERGVSGKGGKGYGLSICKTIVEAHGGAVEIESEPGKGTAVTFTIPVYSGQREGRANE
jgi:signal transduction histidine kinase